MQSLQYLFMSENLMFIASTKKVEGYYFYMCVCVSVCNQGDLKVVNRFI